MTSAGAGDLREDVKLFYDAFTSKQPALFDRVMDPTWVDTPPAPNASPGPAGARELFVMLTGVFPDLAIQIEDILRDGNKVVVRSTISGTQSRMFAGIPSKGQQLRIQAIDIHEFRNGKIVRTWHTEDWMSGLEQLKRN
jgi:steroid delta-isomerase-like uncharacterized protein